MKHLLYLLLFVGISHCLTAQVIDTLPVQKEAFVKELVKQFDDTKRSELKDLSKEFTKAVESGALSGDLLSKMITISNRMLFMRGKAYPQLVGVTKTFLELGAMDLSATQVNNFYDVTTQVMDNSKKGDTKTTLDFFEFVIPLYEINALYHDRGKTWKLSTNAFTLKYSPEGPIVEVPSTDIIGITSTDSLAVYNTGGVYNQKSSMWNGTKGEVDWTRVGLPKAEVNASFNEYSINMSTQAYSVENVTFTYQNYFSRSLTGSLEDKLSASASVEAKRFPRFSANKDDVPPQIISENVVYYGGFTLAGSRISGDNGEDKSRLEISMPNSNQKVLVAYAQSVTINKPEKVTASDAEVSLYFDQDSIHHPSVTVIYDLQSNIIRLVKGDGALAQSRFLDSYHKIDFEADVLTWDLSKDYIDINTVSTSGNKASAYESQEYFSKEKMGQIRGNVSYDPLSILNKYAEKFQYNEIHANEYAKLISPNLTIKQVNPLIFKLIQEGFITYEDKSNMITILPKVSHYVKSNAKKKDYDNIFIVSKTKKQNGRINLVTKEIHLEGVESVPISIATSTIFIPDSLQVTIQENRNMKFDGLFFCGRLDLFGRENQFRYNEFDMILPQIDTLIFNVPDGDRTDASGNAVTRPLNSTLEELVGSVNINLPINKSGRSELDVYPIFTSERPSKIFYDNAEILDGAYDRESFYYEVQPFVLDSLNFLDIGTIKFDGTLYSSDIFPDINQPVKVQSDLSIGFKLSSPPEGFEIYQGKGRFVSDISLTNKGLEGQGLISYMSTSFESSNIVFYPDSLIATTDTFGVEESQGEYESPWVKSAKNLVKWYPYLDSMIAYSDDVNPFQMYDDRIRLDGELIITEDGISGGGIADWDDAQLIAKRFEFRADQILSDTAELKIKTIDGDKVTFNTPNVNAFVDFTKNTGFFKSNTDDNKTEFNYNQYYTTIDEFFWDIDNKKLEFSVPDGNVDGAPFISLHPKQDSLGFNALSADYSLVSSIIEAHGVKEILVADSRIIPDGGEVFIEPEAKMRTLMNATIEANATDKTHIIENVRADISARNSMKASGDYKYSTRDTDPQYIGLSAIDVILGDSSIMNKKKQVVEHVLHAKGVVSRTDNFTLYPNVTFYGDVEMFSSLPNLKIDGFTKIDFQNEYVVSDYFELETQVDPQNLTMQIEGAKDPQGNVIRTGIFVNKAGMVPIYTNIMNNEIGPVDVPLIETNKNLLHDYANNIYMFGDTAKALNPDLVKSGSVLRFEPKTNKVEAQGKLDLALDYGIFAEQVAGIVTTDLSGEDYSFNTTIAMPFDIDKDVLDKFGFYWFEDNYDMTDVNYENVDLMNQMAEFMSEKSLKKATDEIATTGFFSRPKELKESLVLTDVDMTYDPLERVYRSTGKIGVAFIGDRSIHKKINGYVEFGHRLGSDYMNVYLKTGLGDWLFFNYAAGNMEIISSLDDINGMVNAIDPSKRRVKGEDNEFYLYYVGNQMKARSFVQRMKAVQNGTYDPTGEFAPDVDDAIDEMKGGRGSIQLEDNYNNPTGEPGTEPDNSNVPDAVREFEEQQGNKKGKGGKSGKEEKVEEEGPSNLPDAIKDYEEEQNKKNKGSKDKEEKVEEEEEDSSVPDAVKEFEEKEEKKNKGKGISIEGAKETELDDVEEEVIEAAEEEVEEQLEENIEEVEDAVEEEVEEKSAKELKKEKEALEKAEKEAEAEQQAIEEAAEAAKKALEEAEEDVKEEVDAVEEEVEDAVEEEVEEKSAKELKKEKDALEKAEKEAEAEQQAIEEAAEAAKEALEEAEKEAEEAQRVIEEAEEQAKEEAERKAKEEADAIEEAEKKAKEEAAEQKAKEEAEEKAKLEAEDAQKAKEEAEQEAKDDEEEESDETDTSTEDVKKDKKSKSDESSEEVEEEATDEPEVEEEDTEKEGKKGKKNKDDAEEDVE